MSKGSWTKKCVSSTLAVSLILGSANAVLAQPLSSSEANKIFSPDRIATPLKIGDPTRIIDSNGQEMNGETEQKPKQGELDREKAVAAAKQYIQIPSDYSLQSSRYYSANQWNPHGTWHLDFVKKDGDTHVASISIGVHAKTGDLIRFNKWDNKQEERTYPPKVAREDAEKVALEFLARVAPTKSEQVALDNQDHQLLPIIDAGRHHEFTFLRTHNGIPYPQNSLNVGVNTNGEIVYFDSYWDDRVKFSNSEVDTITTDEAVTKFRGVANNQFDLQYVTPWDYGNSLAFLAYSWNNFYDSGVSYIDAESGSALNGRLEAVDNDKLEYIPVTTTKLAPHFSGSRELTEQEALDQAKKLVPVEWSKYKLDTSDYFSEAEGQVTWRFSFTFNDGERRWLSVGIDAKTGALQSFWNDHNIYGNNEKFESKFEEDELVNKAMEAIKKYIPEKAHEFAYVQGSFHDYEYSPTISINFRHLHEGIPSSNSNLYLNMNKTTGEIASFEYYMPRNIQYPSTDNVMAKENALDIYFDFYKTTLQYQTVTNEENQISEAKLVYALRPPVTYEPIFLNAKSGEWHKQSNGEVINLNRVPPTDIDNHWAQDALMLMFQYRALDTDEQGNIFPSQKIKRGEMVKMLILAMNQGQFYRHYGLSRAATFSDVSHDSAYFQYVEAAVDMNLLDKNQQNLNPEETLSREELAVLIVKALQFDKLAQQSHLFHLDVEDKADITNVGHVAIVQNLGIMNAQNGTFLPTKEVTRAEAATAFQRYLEKRNEVQDNQNNFYMYH